MPSWRQKLRGRRSRLRRLADTQAGSRSTFIVSSALEKAKDATQRNTRAKTHTWCSCSCQPSHVHGVWNHSLFQVMHHFSSDSSSAVLSSSGSMIVTFLLVVVARSGDSFSILSCAAWCGRHRSATMFVGRPVFCHVSVMRHGLSHRVLRRCSGHPRPRVVTAPEYRWCPCLDSLG